MRLTLLSALLALAPLVAVAQQPAAVNDQAPMDGQYGAYGNGCNECNQCDQCGHGHNRRRNRDAGFNCNCNGSYKFPVPPLYTFHWPGLYSHQLMTDYHSPWRFPPIKPYADEPDADFKEYPETQHVRPDVRPASYRVTDAPRPVAGQAESISSKLQRLHAE